jgi:outer membrane protein TolC
MPTLQETPLPPAVELPPPAQAAPADVPNRPLTADEAALIALHHQSSMTIALQNVAAAQGLVTQSRSALYPSVGATAAYGRDVVSPTSVNTVNGQPGYSAALTGSQLLFDFNHTRDAVRQAQAQQAAASADLTRAQSDLVLSTKQAFYQYMQNLRLVDVDQANLRNTQDHLALATARLQAGVGLPSDVVTAQTAVSDAVYAVNLARNTASTSRVALATLMGIDPRTPVQAADSNEPIIATTDFNGLLTIALRNRPEIVQLQADIQAARYGVGAAKTTNAPQVVAEAGWNDHATDFPPQNDVVSYGLALQWNLYDSGLTKGRVQQAQANLISAQASLTGEQQAVISDVSQAYLNLLTAQQRIVTADAEVANAQVSVDLAQGRFAAELGVFLDVLDAQTALVTAQTNRVNALTAVNQARAALAHAMNLQPTLVPSAAPTAPKAPTK